MWSRRAIESLRWHYDYIAKDSVQAAKKVKKSIIDSSKELTHFAEMPLMNITQIIRETSEDISYGVIVSFMRSTKKRLTY